MNACVLASVVRKAMVSRMSEAAVIARWRSTDFCARPRLDRRRDQPDRFEPPGGMGELGNSAIVPAVTDAIFAAAGRRLRELPITQRSLWSLTRAREQFIQNGGHLHADLSDALS